MLGAVLLGIVSFVNYLGGKVIARATSLSVIFKLIAPLLLCISFLVTLEYHGKLNLSRLWDIQKVHWNEIFLALSTCGIVFSFNGFNQATLFAGEAKDPQKSLPYAILGSILLSGLLYCLIQASFLLAVPAESLTTGWKNVAFPGDHGPFVGLSILLGLGWLAGIIYLDALISPMGTALAYGIAAPRMFYLLGEKVSYSAFLRKLNNRGIPINALIFSLVVELLSLGMLTSLKAMIGIMVAAFVLCYSVAPASLLVMRQHFPEVHRPFSVKSPRVLAALAMVFSNWMVFSCGWGAIRNLICASLIPVVFALMGVGADRSKLSHVIRQAGWFLFQLVMLTVTSYGVSANWFTFNEGLLLVGGGSLVGLFLSVVFCDPAATEAHIRAALSDG